MSSNLVYSRNISFQGLLSEMCFFLSGDYRGCLATLVLVYLLVSFLSSLTSLQPTCVNMDWKKCVIFSSFSLPFLKHFPHQLALPSWTMNLNKQGDRRLTRYRHFPRIYIFEIKPKMRDVFAKMRECGTVDKMLDFPHDCRTVYTSICVRLLVIITILPLRVSRSPTEPPSSLIVYSVIHLKSSSQSAHGLPISLTLPRPTYSVGGGSFLQTIVLLHDPTKIWKSLLASRFVAVISLNKVTTRPVGPCRKPHLVSRVV